MEGKLGLGVSDMGFGVETFGSERLNAVPLAGKHPYSSPLHIQQ